MFYTNFNVNMSLLLIWVLFVVYPTYHRGHIITTYERLAPTFLNQWVSCHSGYSYINE